MLVFVLSVMAGGMFQLDSTEVLVLTHLVQVVGWSCVGVVVEKDG